MVAWLKKMRPEVVLVRKNLILKREESASGIDEVDARQAIPCAISLCSQMLLHGQRISVPPFTVASFATACRSRPGTRPTAAMMPAEGTALSYMS